jgi:hypothetical protein
MLKDFYCTLCGCKCSLWRDDDFVVAICVDCYDGFSDSGDIKEFLMATAALQNKGD